jgi:hypothetical protein
LAIGDQAVIELEGRHDAGCVAGKMGPRRERVKFPMMIINRLRIVRAKWRTRNRGNREQRGREAPACQHTKCKATFRSVHPSRAAPIVDVSQRCFLRVCFLKILVEKAVALAANPTRCGTHLEPSAFHQSVKEDVRTDGMEWNAGLTAAPTMHFQKTFFRGVVLMRRERRLRLQHADRRRAGATSRCSGRQCDSATLPYPGTSSVTTSNFASRHAPKLVEIATSVASRPRATTMRPMRGALWRASNVYQRPPR